MSSLKNLKTDAAITPEKDRIGGGGFLVDNDLYELTIEHAYITVAESGAMAVNVKFTTDEGKNIRLTEYVTSGKEKGCKNTYTDAKGKEHYLPGFNKMNNLSMLTVEAPLNEVETEEKMLKIYNAEAGGEAPTKVEIIPEMFGKKVWAGVLRVIEDKMTKESGYKEASGETREVNIIDKFFHIDTKQTVTEALAEQEPVFFETWKKEFAGKPAINRSKAGGTAGAPAKGGAPGAGAAKPKAAPLFTKK
jgi:hypothetical protein